MKVRLKLGIVFWIGMLAVFSPAFAVSPDEKLADPKQEQRARDLSIGLRCLVCQNQSIDDSNAPLAKDLRLLVRERIKAGDSDSQVMDFVVARYGDFVLLQPPFNKGTIILWLAPLLLLLAGLFLILRFNRASVTKLAHEAEAENVKQAKLSPEEEAKMKKLLGE